MTGGVLEKNQIQLCRGIKVNKRAAKIQRMLYFITL